ncbi:MAG: DNA polymerase III subunit alpha [Acholeplasmataceae bacterium]|nr:MAG: DNA polymerase III subunit alpha [Acholeplasmataceae bacterium]
MIALFGMFYLQSAYSMLNNVIPVETLVEKAKSAGYDFVALSDENLHALPAFFRSANHAGIKPVIGLRMTVMCDDVPSTFLVYVQNRKGYENLLDLIRLKLDNGEVMLDDLDSRQQGLVWITSAPDNVIIEAILNDDIDNAGTYVRRFSDLLSSFHLGLSLDTMVLEMKVAPALMALAESLAVKVVPLHQTSYLVPEQKEVYEALIRIADEKNTIPEDADYHFLDKTALQSLFSEYPVVFEHAAAIAKTIRFDWQPPRFEMPAYPLEQGVSTQAYLSSLAGIGLKKRLRQHPVSDVKSYQKRLTYELTIIDKMGYNDYFLIVYDFVKYAKNNAILVGPGRGSAAGSLVAWCLGITDVDPIAYDLLFERFLNPERMSLPDIDLDFPDNRRDEVIDYVKTRYGESHMVSIVTFGTFALRSSIRDIARVMRIDPARVAGIIARANSGDFDDTDHELMRLLRVAKAIEGLPRHTGTHPAGMILSKQDLTRHLPLQAGSFTFYQSQFEAKELEDMGLLKIDFLGIRNLTVIDDVRQHLKNAGTPLHLPDIDLKDAKTYQLLSEARTSGVFQLESHGMRNVLRKLKPDNFEDLVAILALYRPGPMNNIDTYIARRAGKPFKYVHPLLEPILKPTYGIIVYQEQIMRIANEFAGYSLAEADLLRRGISKKDKQILEEERQRFIAKCQKQGHENTLAADIYDYIVKFADYGFNRSHSVAYALVAYQMAYLKANHFAAFMSTLLTSIIGNEGLTLSYLDEIRKEGIDILPPDIRTSGLGYQYEDGKIILPLLAIKTLGRTTVQKIIDVRDAQPFSSYHDFKLRLKKELNERNIEMLIHGGALDGFGKNRKTLAMHTEIETAGYEQYITDFNIQDHDDYTFAEKAGFERAALGFNLRYHPVFMYQDVKKNKRLDALADLDQKHVVVVLAYMKASREITTKTGETMAFVTLDDGHREIEAAVFADLYQKQPSPLTSDVRIYTIKAKQYQGRKTYQIANIENIDNG